MNKTAVIGAGQLGSVLARRLVASGHEASVANSRGRESLRQFSRETGANACDIHDIANGVDALIIAIPLKNIPILPKDIFKSLPSHAVVIDACNYVPLRDGEIKPIEEGMPESAWVARQLGVPVVKAFNNISDTSLKEKGRPRGHRQRVALPVAADNDDRRRRAMQLVEALGFDAFDAGALRDSWRQQLGQPAYCTDATLAQLPRLLGRANAARLTVNRNKAMALMAKLPADFPKQDLLRAARFMAGLDLARPGSWLAVGRLVRASLR